MQPLKKPTQLKRWGKKNKISNKKFSRLTGLNLKKMSHLQKNWDDSFFIPKFKINRFYLQKNNKILY